MIRAMVFVALLLAVLPLSPARAVNPDEMLTDPALEHRARVISKDLRCLVCQNQSIDDSDAGLAKDLRVLVRERLKAGDSNEQVIDYVVARYGDFVLLKPPVKASTLVLWAGPAVVALFGILALILFYRRRRTASPVAAQPLSAEERARLNKLLEGDAP
ncbi:cytochrome c-type biogenesis protein [Thalassospiraceae bacterium LMO-SO8]|nr:cytochrome c-type biogenesis protein CcmH [Alphaproteobacteria bacterium LMO-S08]WND74417.1 cytochrome c-type biogenesis protein [Thalassospiraceae bacterium LMO-SO8]